MTTKFLYRFLLRHRLAVLATLSKTNFLEAALVGFAVTPDLEIIFDTANTSRKYVNLLHNPAISFVIGWDDEQTIQLEGIARIPFASELDILLPFYFRAHPDGRDRKENRADLAYFCVKPRWIRYANFRLNQIEEITFSKTLSALEKQRLFYRPKPG